MVRLPSIAASFALTSLLGGVVVAHPGEHHTEEEIRREVAQQKASLNLARDGLNKCSNSPRAVALRERAHARRAESLKSLRQQRGIIPNQPIISKRDKAGLEKWMDVDHESDQDYNLDTPLDVLFGSNATNALVPETIIGPYWVSGEEIRSNVTDGQAGVPIHVDIQFLDVSTCEPIPRMLVDLWQCNATGVYSGVSARGQGGLDSTFLRGVQQTDKDGVTQFDTVFPGHYYGRTNHIHVMSSENATVLNNDTVTDGKANHIGQLYFDQDIIDAVEKTAPYNTNDEHQTLNSKDPLINYQFTEEVDSFFDYVQLGKDVTDGLLMWITIGVNTTADYTKLMDDAAHWCGEGVGGIDLTTDKDGKHICPNPPPEPTKTGGGGGGNNAPQQPTNTGGANGGADDDASTDDDTPPNASSTLSASLAMSLAVAMGAMLHMAL